MTRLFHRQTVITGRKPFPATFRSKMLLYFGLTFAMGLSTVGIASLYGIPFTQYRGEYRLARSEAFRDLGHIADAKKAELSRFVAERQGDVTTFCESPPLCRLVSRVCARLPRGTTAASAQSLRAAVRQSPDYRDLAGHLETIKQTDLVQYDRIRLADATTGMIIASTDERELGLDFSPDPRFRKILEGARNEVVDVLRDPRSGNAYLAIYHAVRSVGRGEDSVTAVFVAYIRPDLFIKTAEIGEQELGKTGDIFLVDQEGTLLTSLKRPLKDGTTPRPLESRIAIKPALLAAEGSEGVIATEGYDGAPVLAAFRHLRLDAETGWGMVLMKDQAEVFAPIHRLVLIFTLGASALCLAVLGLTYAIATGLARPIRELSHAARRVEEGDFSARAQMTGPDEVGVMAASFNAMVQRIQNWHNDLEDEVKARTSELVAVNTRLEREVDERRRAEEAQRASERRFRELLETVHQIAVILDTEGNIVFCNDYLLGLTGWTRDEVLGRNWFDIFIPADASRVKAMFAETLATESLPLHYENPIATKAGTRRTIVWDNTLLRHPDGSLLGTASLGIDVTEHRSTEEQLRHSQKMEAVGQLAGGVAHDFNNLLTVIMGNCELIKRKAGGDDRLHRYVEQILSVSGKAAKLTNSLLAFSRKQLLSIEAIDINECVGEVEALLARVVGEDIEFRLLLCGEQLPVMADRGQLEQVLVNLVANARDAMPGGGKLLIGTRRVTLGRIGTRLHGLEKAGVYGVIQVSDTGCGMDEATRGKIFEPFFTTKDVGKGTGLGLAMVFGTIRQHSGYVDVCSEVGQGTTFRIYLPLIDSETATGIEVSPEPALSGGSETLLLVEDNEEVRQTTAAILENFGYRVIAAADGEEAVARFVANGTAISLVILDMIMPKMNGKELYAALRQIRPDVKALFVSGYAADIIDGKVMLDEELHLLQKPVEVTDLLQKVREMLDQRC